MGHIKNQLAGLGAGAAVTINTIRSFQSIPVSHVMNTEVLTCPPDRTIRDVAAEMRKHDYSSIVVTENNRPIGIWTESDALKCDLSSPESLQRPISMVMSHPVRTIPETMTLSEAGLNFRRQGLRHYIVIDSVGTMVGIITQTDVVLNQDARHFLRLRQVGDCISTPPLFLASSLRLTEAAKQIQDAGVDAAVLEDRDNKGFGIITERDLLNHIADGHVGGLVGDVASRPLISVLPDTALLTARDISQRHHFRHLGVITDDNCLIGLLSFSDILSGIQFEYLNRLEDTLNQRNDALMQSECNLRLAEKVIASAREAIVITDAKGNIEHVNPAFTEVTGYQPDEVLGKKTSMLASGRHDAAFYARMWEALIKDGFWQGEIWNRRKNGEVYPEWLQITAIKDESGMIAHFNASFSDISDRKEAEAHINNLAYFDKLTGLPNRQLFTDRCQEALSSAPNPNNYLGVMVLDIDDFKRINESLGFAVGDDLLFQIAERLSACIREGDTVARFGGNQFGILLPNLNDINEIIDVARCMVEAIKMPWHRDGRELVVTASIGISLYPDDGKTVDGLLKNAETALNRAKELDRSSFQLYSASMNVQSLQRLAMENHLRHALERSELKLNYQIKCDNVTGMASGVEALLRWHNPHIGTVPPSVFIPLAEETGLIHAIGVWVLEEACKQTKAWQDLGYPKLPVAVNLSTLQFHRKNLAHLITDVLDRTGLDPRYLELELTETALMINKEKVSETIADLRDFGLRFAIDDFGTGYSSLSYLKQIPIQTLKIDRSFVKDMTADSDDSAIVSAIIALAKRLGLKVIAEGVETVEQAQLLRQQKCDDLQGFLIARPLPANEVEDLFDRPLL